MPAAASWSPPSDRQHGAAAGRDVRAPRESRQRRPTRAAPVRSSYDHPTRRERRRSTGYGRRVASASLAPFRSRSFTVMWAGALVSNVGTWMEAVALAYYVADTTGKPAWSAIVGAA